MASGRIRLRYTRGGPALIGKRKRTPSGEIYRVRRVGEDKVVDVRPEDLEHLLSFKGYCCTGSKKTPLFEEMGPTPEDAEEPGVGPGPLPDGAQAVLVLRLDWGLGDVLCSTAAVRELRRQNPTARIVYQTNVKGRRYLEYDQPGSPAGSGASPDEMLYDNPDIDEIIDVTDRLPRYGRTIQIKYAGYDMPPLDEPLQAMMFDALQLPRPEDGRYDADYFVSSEETEWAESVLDGAGRYCFIQPHCGWPGKQWSDKGWRAVIGGLIDLGWVPIIGSGRRLNGAPWSWGVNVSGELDIRHTAAIMNHCQGMLSIEGGMSNLRFALGRPAVILTCATKYDVQVWAPPELVTEVRASPDCEPCMWRDLHLDTQGKGPPANLQKCPTSRSLRDVRSDDVMAIVAKHLEDVS